jgi:hypothetical protein
MKGQHGLRAGQGCALGRERWWGCSPGRGDLPARRGNAGLDEVQQDPLISTRAVSLHRAHSRIRSGLLPGKASAETRTFVSRTTRTADHRRPASTSRSTSASSRRPSTAARAAVSRCSFLQRRSSMYTRKASRTSSLLVRSSSFAVLSASQTRLGEAKPSRFSSYAWLSSPGPLSYFVSSPVPPLASSSPLAVGVDGYHLQERALLFGGYANERKQQRRIARCDCA